MRPPLPTRGTIMYRIHPLNPVSCASAIPRILLPVIPTPASLYKCLQMSYTKNNAEVERFDLMHSPVTILGVHRIHRSLESRICLSFPEVLLFRLRCPKLCPSRFRRF